MQPTLKELQSRFKAVLQRPESPPESPEDDPVGVTRIAGLDAYHYAYFARIVECLEEDFPRVRETLGEESFENTMRAYLTAYPSRYPSIAQVGQDLPKFLSERGEHELAEVARFEWLRCLCSWSELPEVRHFSDLAKLDEATQPRQKLKLASPRFIFESPFRAHEESFKVPGPLTLIAFRGLLGFDFIELTTATRAFLAAIEAGMPLGKLVQMNGFDPAWLTDWAGRGLITGFEE